jgi:magnesium-transporting ATPase (P-type)
MVTGDFSLTAQAIAKDIGILTSNPKEQHKNRVISGGEISEVLEQAKQAGEKNVEGKVIDWVEKEVRSHEYMVFARTSPEQK